MLKYILMILGGVIFIAGYYFMQQNEGRGKTMMFYSLFAYAGLTLVILSGARVLDPFFESIGDSGEMDPEIRSAPRRIRKKTLKRRQRIIIRSKEVTVRGIKSIVKNKRNI